MRVLSKMHVFFQYLWFALVDGCTSDTSVLEARTFLVPNWIEYEIFPANLCKPWPASTFEVKWMILVRICSFVFILYLTAFIYFVLYFVWCSGEEWEVTGVKTVSPKFIPVGELAFREVREVGIAERIYFKGLIRY